MLSAPADGYTVMHLNLGMVGVQVVQKKFDLNKQLIPLTIAGDTPMVLMVGTQLTAQDPERPGGFWPRKTPAS